VMMPGPTTNDILKQLHCLNCDPKIILLTVVRFHEDEVKELADTGNIVGYVKKPFEMDELLKIIKKELENQ